MERIVSVEAMPDYRLRVTFSDGMDGIVDLSDMVGKGVFSALADPAQFAEVFVDSVTQTAAWPGGIDLCPDSLYAEIARQEKAA